MKDGDSAAFDLQLDLCLLGLDALFGWEKATGNAEELRWWEERVIAGARHLRDAYPAEANERRR